jgi:hypothetical protein
MLVPLLQNLLNVQRFVASKKVLHRIDQLNRRKKKNDNFVTPGKPKKKKKRRRQQQNIHIKAEIRIYNIICSLGFHNTQHNIEKKKDIRPSSSKDVCCERSSLFSHHCAPWF